MEINARQYHAHDTVAVAGIMGHLISMALCKSAVYPVR